MALSARTASFVASPVFRSSNTFLASAGKVIFGRADALEDEVLGETDVGLPESAAVTLSLESPESLDSEPPPPQAVSSKVAVAVSAIAARVVRDFTVVPPWN